MSIDNHSMRIYNKQHDVVDQLPQKQSPEEIKAARTSKIANLQLNRITRYQVEKGASFLEKAARSLNISVWVGHVINKFSILRGALKNWDSERLLAGKHATFEKVGADHIQLNAKYGEIIDATYLEASSLAKKLEEFGGQRVQFKPHLTAQDPYPHKKVTIHLSDNTSFQGYLLDSAALLQHDGDIGPIESYYKAKGMSIITDKEGELYAVPIKTYKELLSAKALNEGELIQDVSSKETGVQEVNSALTTKVLNKEFSGYYFEKNSPELKQILENLDIGKTPWILKEIDGKAFLVKRQDLSNISLCHRQDPSLSNLEIIPAKPLEETREQGTVILSMNQTEVYEQYGSEFLTFALEGVNVIAYNNGGKGLSKGLSDTNSINNSIEQVYQYLRNVKQIPDDKILAKGQCFGGAPSAWLGRQHPRINVMIDQSPANFYDVAAKVMKDRIAPSEKDTSFKANLRRGLIKFFGVNYIIDGIAKAIFAGYNSPENLRHNRGHKLIHHNIPTEFGTGGDKLVPDKHIEQFIDASLDVPSRKIRKMSNNPGGVHVSHWFANSLSHETVMNFMRSANLTTDMYQVESE